LAHLAARPVPLSATSIDDVIARLGLMRPVFFDVVDGIRKKATRRISTTVEEMLRAQTPRRLASTTQSTASASPERPP
jgi:hypothetical protein